LLLLLVRVRRERAKRQGLAEEEVGHEDAVLVVLIVGVGEDVGALQGLRREAEDVVDDENGAFGVGGPGRIWVGERGSAEGVKWKGGWV